MRRFIGCDICRRVKHPKRSDIKQRSHVLYQSNQDSCVRLTSMDLYPRGGGGVRYILVCFEVFSKYVELYSLKTATTRSCFNKLVKHHFLEEVKPKVILSDKGTQFQPPVWKGTMQKHDVKFRYCTIRHPQTIQLKDARKKLQRFAGFIVIPTIESGQN